VPLLRATQRPTDSFTNIALASRTLFIAGDFSHVNATDRSGLAEVDIATGERTPFDAK
jgi:hypothetical protein